MPKVTRDPNPAPAPPADTYSPFGSDRARPERRAQQMRARQIMSAPVVSACPKTTLRRAIDLMLEAGISGLPVIDAQGLLVGIVTEGDLLRRTELGTEGRAPRWIQYLRSPGKLAEEYAHSHGRLVEEVMSSPVTTVTEDAPLHAIVEAMARARIKRVPVLRGSAVVGMISRADIVCRPPRSSAASRQLSGAGAAAALSAFKRPDYCRRPRCSSGSRVAETRTVVRKAVVRFDL